MRIVRRRDGGARRAERGVIAPILAIGLVMLLGMAAFVIDYGALWQFRRQTTIGTDAAALAAAQSYATAEDGCAVSAPDFFTSNAPTTAAHTCVLAPGSTRFQGSVTVNGTADVAFGFGRVLGIDSQTVTASTTASWMQPASATGLRPIGLCLAAMQDLGAVPAVFGNTFTMPWNFNQPDLCALDAGGNGNGGNGNGNGNGNGGNSTTPGSWGYVDFNGGGNNGNEIADWTENGYPGSVALGANYEGFQGAVSAIEDEIDGLIANGECVGLPIYEKVGDGSPGNSENFLVVDIATGVFTSVQWTGAPDNRQFSFRYEECIVQGEGGAGGVGDFGGRVIRICDVDSTLRDDCP